MVLSTIKKGAKMITNKEYSEIMFLQEQLQGLSEYSDSRLREVLIKKYGSEVLETKEKTLKAPGFLNSVRRAIGLGGYETEQTVITVSDKIKKMDSDELMDFWMDMARKKLSTIVRRKAGLLDESVRESFSHHGAPKIPEDRREIWNLAVSLCENVEEFEHATPPGHSNYKDLRHAIGEYVQKYWPDQFDKFNLKGDTGYVKGVIEALIFVVQNCDATEKQAITNWVGSPSFENSSNGLGLYPFLMTQLAKEARDDNGNSSEEGPSPKKKGPSPDKGGPSSEKKETAKKEEKGRMAESMSETMGKTGGKMIRTCRRRNSKVNPLPLRTARGE